MPLRRTPPKGDSTPVVSPAGCMYEKEENINISARNKRKRMKSDEDCLKKTIQDLKNMLENSILKQDNKFEALECSIRDKRNKTLKYVSQWNLWHKNMKK